MASFPKIKSIGKPSAEEDAVLEYFLTTDSVRLLQQNEAFLIVGRKGSGKTALVRHFTKDQTNPYYRALNLRGYPWALHAELANSSGSEMESYVSSWRYLIACQASSAVLEKKWSNEYLGEKILRNFFTKNYGAPVIDVDKVFSPDKIIMEKATIDPQYKGLSIGSIEFRTVKPDFGQQIDAVATEIMRLVSDVMKYRGSNHIELHFDELDFGLEKFDRNREILIIGLVLAVQSFRGVVENSKQLIRPFIYLRHDLWDSLNFSDRNKISRGPTLILNWNTASLREMVDVRLAKIGGSGISWASLIDERLMRGNQQKWDHIVSRTLDRPRDVISFINIILAGKDNDALISNEDISKARPDYSTYFKEELDDEIKAHWPEWEEAVNALRDIGYVTFTKSQFEEAYDRIKSKKNKISDAPEALKKLFEYSVVSYLRPRSGGGSDWVWRYKNRTSTYDARAERFKVHPGLTEFANLREERKDRKLND
jgi:GTPase SAR1 family protein